MSVAEFAPVMNAEPAVSLEGHEVQYDPRQLEIYERRYVADCAAIPFVLREYGVHLSDSLSRSLEGTGRDSDHATTGLGRATIDIGKVINGLQDPRSLFDYGKLPTEPIEDQYGYVDNEPVLPSAQSLLDASVSPALGKSGRMLAGMLADVVEPYKKRDGDGYVELPLRISDDVYETGRYGTPEGGSAKLCSNTEYHFAIEHHGFAEYSGLQEISVGGEVVALKKHSGDHTAILIKAAVLNGVRLPVGSIMITGKDDEDQPTFAFGRLSVFVFDSPEEALREMPDTVEKEFIRNGKMHYLETAMERFNQKYKGAGHITTSERFKYLIDEVGYVTESAGSHTVMKWTDTLKAVLDKVYGSLDDPEFQQIQRLLQADKLMAGQAASAKLDDARVARENEWKIRPNTHQSIIDRIAQRKARLYKTFGANKIEKVRELLDIKALIEAKL